MFDTLITGGISAVGSDRAGGPAPAGSPTIAAATCADPEPTLLLVADPDPILLRTFPAALLNRGVGRVIRVGAVEGVEEVLVGNVIGELALIGLGFGDTANRLIAQLRQAGWPRVLALAPTSDPGPLLDAVRAGATGVLRRPPGTPVRPPDTLPLPELSAREVEILRMVADGRSNSWIGGQLSLSSFSVKKHLAKISRKFGRGDREQLVAMALRGGIID
jgi:DNA-binding NarL/FixJ family response regulator